MLLREPYDECVTKWHDITPGDWSETEYKSILKYNYSEEACSAVDMFFEPLSCSPECFKLKFVARFEKRNLRKFEYPDVNENEIMIKVRPKRLERKIIADVPMMPPSVLLSNVGGLLGLWLGASILTLVEILELLGNVSFWIVEMIQTRNCRDKRNTIGGQL